MLHSPQAIQRSIALEKTKAALEQTAIKHGISQARLDKIDVAAAQLIAVFETLGLIEFDGLEQK